ncbi:MAG: hypothetical protein HGA90_04425 [Alphaproteobacteria bacterium]|nr:hypothetical protein [Alphaproteobacteria bacterium]
MERHLIKTLLLACLVIAALFAFGCGAAAEPAEPTPSPAPEVVSLEVVDLNVEDFGEMPAPTPTPNPTPTPLPFSYYAPTVNMTYEELVGSTDDMDVKAKVLLKDGFPDPKTYYIIVDKQWQVVMVYKRIDDGTKLGKPDLTQPVRYMLCSTGNPNKEYGHETTSGIWQIEILAEDLKSTGCAIVSNRLKNKNDRKGEAILIINRINPLSHILRIFSEVVNKLSYCYHVRIRIKKMFHPFLNNIST